MHRPPTRSILMGEVGERARAGGGGGGGGVEDDPVLGTSSITFMMNR